MPKAAAVASLPVCVQAICTEWSKVSRGGEEAVRRNRVPEALKLPEFTASALPVSYVLHQARYSETNGFREPIGEQIKSIGYEPVELQGVSLALGKDSLAVYYQWQREQGAPRRPTQKREVFSLTLTEWGRVCYNGRHGRSYMSWASGTWWYEKWVYNVGLFHKPTRSAFLTTQPAHVSSHMAHLW